MIHTKATFDDLIDHLLAIKVSFRQMAHSGITRARLCKQYRLTKRVLTQTELETFQDWAVEEYNCAILPEDGDQFQ